MSYQVICVLGDSITNGYWDEEGLGWFGRLSQKIAAEYPLKFGFNNLAQSGDRSTDVLHRLRSEVLSRKPDILIIAIGINDLVRRNDRGAPMDLSPHFRKRVWQDIFSFIKSRPGRTCVLNIQPVAESRGPSQGSEGWEIWYRNDDVDIYNAELKQWCHEAGVAFIDIADAWKGRGVEDHLQDVAHPNGKGHKLIADQVFEELKRLKFLS